MRACNNHNPSYFFSYGVTHVAIVALSCYIFISLVLVLSILTSLMEFVSHNALTAMVIVRTCHSKELCVSDGSIYM